MTTSTTTLMPLDPALSPQHMTRILPIAADLLPEEIVAARRARRTRTWVLGVVALVVLALAGWYVYAVHGVNQANAERDEVTAQQSRLQREQAKYGQVVNVQAETKAIAKQLETLLAKDLQWATLIDRLRTSGAASGVTVQGIAAALTDDKAAPVTSALPSASGATAIGTITVTGTAPDKPSVAKYVDTLNTLPTVADPFVTSVSSKDDKTVDFELTVTITDDALCGRFTTPCKNTGGN